MPCWWLRKISQAKDEAQIILPEVSTSVNKFSIFWSWNGYKLFGCLLLIMAIIQHLGLNLRSFRLFFSLNYKHYIIILYCITYLFAFVPIYFSLIFLFAILYWNITFNWSFLLFLQLDCTLDCFLFSDPIELSLRVKQNHKLVNAEIKIQSW